MCVCVYKPYESFPPTSFFTLMLLCLHAYPKVQTCRCVFLRACGFLYAWDCILAACFHEVTCAYVYCYACMFLCIFLHSVCIPLWFVCVRASEGVGPMNRLQQRESRAVEHTWVRGSVGDFHSGCACVEMWGWDQRLSVRVHLCMLADHLFI